MNNVTNYNTTDVDIDNEPGLSRDYDCTKSQKVDYLLFNYICYGAASIFVALRIYSRVYLVRYFGADDIWIIISMVIAYGILIMDTVYIARDVAGVPSRCIPLDVLADYTKAQYISNLFFVFELQSVKMSLLTFYLRLSASPTFRTVVQATIIITWLWTIAFLLAGVFACWPLEKAWDEDVIRFNSYEKWCVNLYAVSWCWTISSVLLDWWVLLLPVKMLLKLRVPWKEKTMVIGVFLIGLLACAAAMVRVPAIHILIHNPDSIYGTFLMDLTTTLEHSVSVMAACCPALKPLVAKYFPSITQRVTGRSSSDSRTQRQSHTSATADSLTVVGSNNANSSKGQRGSSVPQTPISRRKLSMFIPDGRLNELGLAPQMPPQSNLTRWMHKFNVFNWFRRGRENLENSSSVETMVETGNSGHHLFRRGGRGLTMDLNDNDFCVNSDFQHQLPSEVNARRDPNSLDA